VTADRTRDGLGANDAPNRVVVIPADVWLDGLDELASNGHHAGFIARREFGNPKIVELAPAIDIAHLDRQRDWSTATFGPGARTAAVLDHITKELAEVAAAPDDVTEWADVIILALDGAMRAGHEPAAIIAAIRAKQVRNEARNWPDWRTADPTKAIEHLREAGNDEGYDGTVLT